jgi:hypothetical protein
MPNLYPDTRVDGRTRTLESVGLDCTVPPVRRGADGLVDLNYYLERGRNERAKAARDLFAALGRIIGGLAASGLRSHRLRRRRLHHV